MHREERAHTHTKILGLNERPLGSTKMNKAKCKS